MSKNVDLATGLSPIVKWPGGKEKELKYIIPNTPKFERFFEPFVGGGSVFMGIKANQYYINDLSSELIALYKNIATTDIAFFKYAEAIDKSWENAAVFFERHRFLIDTYIKYRSGVLNNEELERFIHTFCENNQKNILDILELGCQGLPCILVKEIEINLLRKMQRMRELEIKKHELPNKDLYDNIETAIKSAVYMNFRYLYNNKDIVVNYPELYCALFFFVRNYAYSGMFRYSGKGDFNVPYGGIAYNGKSLATKLNYYRSNILQEHFANTRIFNMDFEAFLRTMHPNENDFIFLDPPYDSEFSTYAQNSFTKEDQRRLANYMINECKAQWMLVIKNTDFIHSLYNKDGINVRSFDKEYNVNFMNRNNKKVTHLLITNFLME